MKKQIYLLLIPLCLLISGCSNVQESWQGAYYYGGTDDTDIVQGPVFTNYKGCKEWALQISNKAYNGYAYCSKNCKSSVDNTPICEDVVRTRHPLPGFGVTFDERK